MTRKITVAVVGATGQVGAVMLDFLAQSEVNADSVRCFASARSAGKTVIYRGAEVTVEDLATADLNGIDIALFSAGGATSASYAPKFTAAGAVVIDNSSHWRLDPEVPLVVSEVNPYAIAGAKKGIIANPNCTTMAAMPPLRVLHDAYGLTRLKIATYQATSGSGVHGVAELAGQLTELVKSGRIADLVRDGQAIPHAQPEVYAAAIAANVVPVAGGFVDDGSLETDEEQKLRNESRKILEIPELLVAGTCVRVPVFTGHSLVVHAEFERTVDVAEAQELLAKAPGVELCDMPNPRDAAGKNPSFVGRVRHDQSVPDGKGLVFFIANDNLRKGAALNAVQLAEIVARQLRA
ncbi:aspartate-semialdehyde dehydrogenase [Canibacter sp. lx-45]|uniref:aspartate-semialdehyde dehydrogenase n=1 Tax=Canibacter zhuwentaonis TaxID=2837491 RepID=UPI001BDC941B|nr:aspartate-semialdehyde dehydrogenase [Canibacter zhuwentaonis]MBT1035730.1 aspartate-semialdehyde dehydrogenase [Canibacter zhuwentaonis]